MEAQSEGGATARRPRRFTRQERAFVENYVAEGYCAAAIAEALGRSTHGVVDFCRRHQIAYASQQHTLGTHPQPRIFNGRRPRPAPEEVREIVRAARHTCTLAGTAREVGYPEQYVEKVLQHHAPVIWHTYIKRGGLDAGQMFDIVAKDWQNREDALLERYGLESVADWDALVRDHGREKVQAWLDDLELERRALTRVRRALVRSLERLGS